MEQACLAGVVQKALFLCSVIDRVDLKPDKIHPGLVSGNSAAPAPQVCVQHPAPRRGVTAAGQKPADRTTLCRRPSPALFPPLAQGHGHGLGIKPAGRDKRAVLYRESQFTAICEAIAGRAIAAKRAALLPA